MYRDPKAIGIKGASRFLPNVHSHAPSDGADQFFSRSSKCRSSWFWITALFPQSLSSSKTGCCCACARSIWWHAGFTHLEADEAVAILESRSDIALLFTDIQMPGSMDGLKLAHAVRERWRRSRSFWFQGN